MQQLFILLILGVALTGCAMQPQSLGYGLIQNSVDPVTVTREAIPKISFDVDGYLIKAKREATPKVGRACGINILGLYAGGDMSIELAKYNGSITKVSSVNTEVFSILGLIATRCTIVSGS